MDKLKIVINGNNFSNLESFHCEIDKVLTKNLQWQTGHNLNAFNDLLWGGFGVYEYEEPIIIIWKNLKKSRVDLGKEVIERLIEIIKEHDHIALILRDHD
jgi:RNAse (barnase) inhibitor barstar